ncbi:MAG: hypothetical protein AAF985_20175 [Bacteroidota bacterium]
MITPLEEVEWMTCFDGFVMLTMKAIAYKDLQSLTIVSCVIAGIGWWE